VHETSKRRLDSSGRIEKVSEGAQALSHLSAEPTALRTCSHPSPRRSMARCSRWASPGSALRRWPTSLTGTPGTSAFLPRRGV